MLNIILFSTIIIVLFVVLYQFVVDKINIKEALDSSSPGQTDAQKEQRKKLLLAQNNSDPSEKNSSNVKYLNRTFQDIENNIHDIKTMLSKTFDNINKECCSLNTMNKKDSCAKSEKLPACTNKNPCAPCKDKDPIYPYSCCQSITIPK